MKANPVFFLLSIILALLALAHHVIAHGDMMQGEHRRAMDLEAAAKQREASLRDNQTIQPIQKFLTPDPEADRLLQNSKTLNKIGLVFTISCVLSLGMALHRRERGLYLIVILLLLFDVGTMLLL